MDGKLVHHEAYTPMAYDIQTAQYLYGANATTEIEATTYTFDQSVPRVQALYDTGGIDAIDLMMCLAMMPIMKFTQAQGMI